MLPAAAAGCGKGTQVESGAVLLELSVRGGVTTPDELRIWVYDDTGALWNDARVPGSGALVPESATQLGTVLIQPGAAQGALRIHVRGLAAAARVADGALSIPAGMRGQGSRCGSTARSPPTATATACPTRSTTARPSPTRIRRGCPGGDDGGAGRRRRRRNGRAAATAATTCADADRRRHGRAHQLRRVRRLQPRDGRARAPTARSARPRSASTASAAPTPASVRADRATSRTTTAPACAYAQGTDPAASARAALPATAPGRAARRRAAPRRTASCARGGSECTSTFCKDGVCCNSACDAPCRTCETGTCADVSRKRTRRNARAR